MRGSQVLKPVITPYNVLIPYDDSGYHRAADKRHWKILTGHEKRGHLGVDCNIT